MPLNFLAQTPPSVAPGGLIIAGGGPDTALVAIKDGGDHAEVVWRRDDVDAVDHGLARPARASPTRWSRDGDADYRA